MAEFEHVYRTEKVHFIKAQRRRPAIGHERPRGQMKNVPDTFEIQSAIGNMSIATRMREDQMPSCAESPHQMSPNESISARNQDRFIHFEAGIRACAARILRSRAHNHRVFRYRANSLRSGQP